MNYRANTFTINFPDGWQEKTIRTLIGPIEDGIQHNVLINAEQDAPFGSFRGHAEWRTRALEDERKYWLGDHTIEE